MSGGSFDYAFAHLVTFADELEQKLDDALHAENPEVRLRLRRLVSEARRNRHARVVLLARTRQPPAAIGLPRQSFCSAQQTNRPSRSHGAPISYQTSSSGENSA